MKKKSSSPISSIGEASASRRRPTPLQNARRRQSGTGVPRAASVCTRRAYSTATPRRRELERIEGPLPEHRREVCRSSSSARRSATSASRRPSQAGGIRRRWRGGASASRPRPRDGSTRASSRASRRLRSLARYATPSAPPPRPFVRMLALVGAVGVGLGVILFFAANWDEIPRAARLALLVGGIVALYALGDRLSERAAASFRGAPPARVPPLRREPLPRRADVQRRGPRSAARSSCGRRRRRRALCCSARRRSRRSRRSRSARGSCTSWRTPATQRRSSSRCPSTRRRCTPAGLGSRPKCSAGSAPRRRSRSSSR